LNDYFEQRRLRDEKRARLRQLWREPEKHYVRVYGWLPTAKARVTKLKKPARYFTLCGEEAIDVLHFAAEGIIERNARGFPGVGVCELYSQILAEAMRLLKFVGKQKVGRFEDIVKEQDFGDWFEYDIVNLDLMGVPFPEGEAPFEGTWGAIDKVLECQSNHKTPFDLFLTFRGDPAGTSQQAIEELVENLDSNLEHAKRKEAFAQKLGHSNVRILLARDYPQFLLIGLPKLVLTRALEHGFDVPSILEFFYRRVGDRGEYKIVKFIFSFEFPRGRPRRLSNVPHSVELYEQGVLRVFQSQPVNVDHQLGMQPLVSGQLQNAVNALLLLGQ